MPALGRHRCGRFPGECSRNGKRRRRRFRHVTGQYERFVVTPQYERRREASEHRLGNDRNRAVATAHKLPYSRFHANAACRRFHQRHRIRSVCVQYDGTRSARTKRLRTVGPARIPASDRAYTDASIRSDLHRRRRTIGSAQTLPYNRLRITPTYYRVRAKRCHTIRLCKTPPYDRGRTNAVIRSGSHNDRQSVRHSGAICCLLQTPPAQACCAGRCAPILALSSTSDGR